ncbi:GNAT family N-acetyltransferase [Microbacterium sp. MPKO10]|uniref:GNAT family N-acetyltransferase n=1 Tax=Microbacterium sp. MPKO10 TaxID=2989818 RepID=UPI00223648BD|nr:GNAT family protein [Microbacterium sp. MPKO10]MCW4460052.1 GNAT family N-acetyltransferase [Microbacterium sp. MPKO10]
MASTLTDVDWPVQTARLSIRAAREGDADAVRSYRCDPGVAQWMPSDALDAETFRAQFIESRRLASTLVIERDGRIIGDLLVRVGNAWAQDEIVDEAHGVEAEIGWCLAPEESGVGYATEAVRAMIRVCFESLGLRRLTADCFADNAASWRLMERVGMRRESYTVRDSLHRTGKWLDGMTYALLREEWESGAR